MCVSSRGVRKLLPITGSLKSYTEQLLKASNITGSRSRGQQQHPSGSVPRRAAWEGRKVPPGKLCGRECAPASRNGEMSTRQALGSVTRVQVTVCFFKFLNSSFKLLQKGVKKQHVSFNPPSKKTNNKQTKNNPNKKPQTA